MPEYKKVGYLTSSFKLFHLKDQNKKGVFLSLSRFSQDPDPVEW